MVMVSGYTIRERLYVGLRCLVFRATRDVDGLPCVLKVSGDDASARDIAQIRAEFVLLSRLEHAPDVVRAYGCEVSDARAALVLEDFGAVSLAAWMRTPRTLEAKLRVAAALADALGAVHEQQIIHKDINPSNALVGPDDRLKLSDFGIATALSRENPEVRSPGEVEGTLAYISPEQTGRMNRPVDYRTDLYSLGATFYELFTGAVLFATDDMMDIVHGHLARRPTPPRERAPEVPSVLSDLLLRLLAKTPEERYQSARGVARDLRECLARLTPEGDIPPFDLGASDRSERFEVPQRLYGRDAELLRLLASYERAAGRAELAVVTGPAGIGKSLLVHELYKPVTARHGYFIEGKFDQLQRTTPYSAIVAAFRSLVRQVLGESDEALARWREDLAAALGSAGAVVTEVIPEVELIVGPQPPVAPLAPAETENRFAAVFGSFIRVFARAERPLALFLDDLQWADAASVRLLELVLRDPRPTSLLVVCAWRDAEVSATHPVAQSVAALCRDGVSIETLRLPSLTHDDVSLMVADAVGRSTTEAAPLAALIAAKTDGNPLFISELLKAAWQDGLLTLDPARGHWAWDLAAIESRGITDNVVTLMIGKMRRLASATQRTLTLAALVGARFDLGLLAALEGATVAAVFERILPAAQAGFITATSGLVPAPESDGSSALVVRDFRFVHDRVQQAAYALLDAAEREVLHGRVGQHLLASGELFEAVDHLNRARAQLTDAAARATLARNNLVAGRRARAALAYAAARDYLTVAEELQAADAWAVDYAHTRDLHVELAGVLCQLADYDRAEALCKSLLAHVQTDVERVDVYTLLVELYNLPARYDEVFAAARSGAALAGIVLPIDASPQEAMGAFGLAAQEAGAALGDRSVDALADAPEIVDAMATAVLRLLMRTLSAAYFKNPLLYGIIVCKGVRIMLEHGASRSACDMYANYGLMLAALLGAPRAGYAFGSLALRQAERFGAPDAYCRAAFLTANFVLPWTRPLREAVDLNARGFRAGVEGGDITYQGWILIYTAFTAYYLGGPLAEVSETVTEHLRFTRRTANHIATDILEGVELAVEALRGHTRDAATFAWKAETEEARVRAWGERRSSMALGFFPIFKAEVLYLHERPREALDVLLAGEPLLAAVPGNFATAYHPVFTALSITALLPELDAEAAAALRPRLDAAVARVTAMAAECAHNYEHLRLLVAAEVARVEGRAAEALDAYEEAIERAQTSGFSQHATLAYELAGRYFLARGRRRVARTYLLEAVAGYRLRGAARKVQLLEDRHGDLLSDVLSARPMMGTSATVTSTGSHSSSLFDLGSALKASQTISQEIVLDRLLENLLLILVQNAGAQRGVLAFEEGGELVARVRTRDSVVAVVGGVPTAERGVETITPTPLARFDGACEEVVRYVARTRESLVLRDASGEGAYARSGYVTRNRTRSVLCAPIVAQGNLHGLLYLENNLSAGAFTDERVSVLQVLSTQAAISIQNARLYESLEARNRELARTHASTLRFVPEQYLRLLGHDDITAIRRGDQVELEVSVLFSDVRGFSALSERLGAAGTFGFINEYLAHMEPVIYRNHGVVNQYYGDGVMALFPRAPDDALRAGVELFGALGRFNGERASRGAEPVRIGVGINAGTVMLGTIGGGGHLACTVIGDTVNLASRVEGMTSIYGAPLVVTESVAARAEGFHLRAIGRALPKGKTVPVTVYQSLDAEPEAVRAARTASAGAFAEALAQYQRGDFEAARAGFDAVVAADASDEVARKYSALCAKMAALGRPEGWDGVHRLDTK